MMHDFKRFPELTNSQLQIYYFESPHKQLIEDFRAKVVKVIDGDTIRVEMNDRDFDFPIRFSNTAAPEMSEAGGREAQSWLENQILGKEVDIVIHESRVGKWGRLLGEVISNGVSMNEESMRRGFAIPFSERESSTIPNFSAEIEVSQW